MRFKIYFAHPETFKVPGREIESQLKAAGFEVFNPFRGPAQWAWINNPCLATAKRIWHVDFGAILDSDALFAWVPEPSTGTAMEIYVGLFLYPKRVYIVSNQCHPFLMASGRTFSTIDEAVEQMKRDFDTAFSQKKPLKATKSPNTPTRTSKKIKNGGGGRVSKERGVQELITETWALIDKAKARLNAANASEKERISWAGVLANAIGTLNRLYWKVGAGKVDEEDLASILSKVPEKYAKMVKRRLKVAKQSDFGEIGRGDLVELVWLDASTSRSVVKLSNRVVATYKRTVGRFLAVVKDERYGVGHVILSTETTDNATHDVTSIPLPIVVDVRRLAPKEAKRTAKNGADVMWTSPLKEGGYKAVWRKVRKC